MTRGEGNVFRRWRIVASAAICAVWLAHAAHADDLQANLAALKSRLDAGAIPGIHSVLVIADGKTLAEWYFTGDDEALRDRGPVPLPHVEFGPATLHDVRSVTKSVVSILFGIAQDDGTIKSLDTPVLDYFPEYTDLRTPERLKIRVRDVLTMTSGLDWDERKYPYSDPRNPSIAMEIAPDLFRYVLSQPIAAPPGTRFSYSGGDVALVGAIIARATKTPLDSFAKERLFGPLGITEFEWSKAGVHPRAEAGLRMTTRDMGKIGSLMLAGGEWNGKRIVSQTWVNDATTPHAAVAPDPKCGTKYGYLWWLFEGCETQPPTPGFAGIGNGGQRIWVFPSRKLVVVSTAGLYNDPKQGEPPFAVLTGVLGGTPKP
jgi:CubicO group peptidase (beta-lactamase class C family)